MRQEEILKEISNNIQRIRKERNLTQLDLAVECDFEKSNMSRIERGKSNITIGTLNKISNALKVPIKDLLPD